MRESAEHRRLRRSQENLEPWRKWGPYLSDRQWGTVREDYSVNGDAWNYFSHEQARSRAYRWGEDGIGGLSDDEMRLCFAFAFWNERDPILKERYFGLTNSEGNHGEDVKEYYFYLDNTPTHAYMRMLYKYPQRLFPYDDLVRVNRERDRMNLEYELLDTGIFKDDRYFDIFIEYAKAAPEDILIRITAINRGPEPASLHLLPHLWFRNSWWNDSQKAWPLIRNIQESGHVGLIAKDSDGIGTRYLYCDAPPKFLFTNNESNTERLFGRPNAIAYVKDGINDAVVENRREAVNPEQWGTKAAAHYRMTLAAQESRILRFRLTPQGPSRDCEFFGHEFESRFRHRKREADDFYRTITPATMNRDSISVMRQAYAGMLWSKQAYLYELDRWLDGRVIASKGDDRLSVRNREWFHMVSADVISMPDKWEYPWFAAWDLAFHSVVFSFIDPHFAADQLELMLQSRYIHPNGQLPAYEWNFSDVNPPVHAWAALFNYRIRCDGEPDEARAALKRAFHKLLVNFTWWVNRKDRFGRNVFEGGFLGLDNIGVFDRSAPLPSGGYLEQADGTAWMALFSQNMLEIALELALEEPEYEEFALKFLGHFIWIASSMYQVGDDADGMWDETDGFFYDVMRLPDGSANRIKLRSMVGLLPLCAATVYPAETLEKLPRFAERARWFANSRKDLIHKINPSPHPGLHGRRLLSVLNDQKLRRVLTRLLDPDEFLSDYGIRSLSRYHLDHPYVHRSGDVEHRVDYWPAESQSGMFGGNSNWRGPIWLPVNLLIVRALMQLYSYHGDEFKVECPTGSGKFVTLFDAGMEIVARLNRIFLRDEEGRRPVFGGAETFQKDPHWRDHLQFYEYFHGDNGAGIGASHQTGWTGLIAPILMLFHLVRPEDIRDRGVLAAFDYVKRSKVMA